MGGPKLRPIHSRPQETKRYKHACESPISPCSLTTKFPVESSPRRRPPPPPRKWANAPRGRGGGGGRSSTARLALRRHQRMASTPASRSRRACPDASRAAAAASCVSRQGHVLPRLPELRPGRTGGARRRPRRSRADGCVRVRPHRLRLQLPPPDVRALRGRRVRTEGVRRDAPPGHRLLEHHAHRVLARGGHLHRGRALRRDAGP